MPSEKMIQKGDAYSRMKIQKSVCLCEKKIQKVMPSEKKIQKVMPSRMKIQKSVCLCEKKIQKGDA